ncbi:MAG: methyl-accepting chemotaxis protein [Halanaerobiaceae bacterium]
MLNLQLKGKLILFFLLIGLIPVLIVGVLSYNNARNEIEDKIFAEMKMYGNISDTQLEDYFAEREGDVEAFATTDNIYQSLNKARELNWETDSEEWLNQVDELDRFAPNFADLYDYSFAFLTDPDGNVVYSTTDEVEIGTDLSDREYVQGASNGEMTWSDLFYSDVIEENSLAISIPVRSEGSEGELIGTANLLMEQQQVDSIVHDGLGELGETADAYLIDEDGMLLTNTMLGDYTDGAALNESIDTRAVELLSEPIRNEDQNFSTTETYQEYRGVPVLGEVLVTRLGNSSVGMVVEVDQDEVFAGVEGMRNAMIVILVIAVALIIVFAYLIARSLSRPITSATSFARTIADGDLTGEVNEKFSDRNDEIGVLLNALLDMKDNLNQMLANVRESSLSVSSASEQISTGNEDLSQRTQEQASSLEEFSASVEEMTSSMESSTANASEARSISNDTKESVHEGERVVNDLQEAMTEITDSSHEISEIIDQVNDIAFQTNLLALNAAVEAARAGEAGQGFAVVASEVRNLAGRAAEAAEDIEKLISDSIEKTENGNELMDETEAVLEKIIENTEKTTDVVGEIAASLQEQTTAADEINNSIEELNQVTQDNASLVEEIASSSENMNSEAVKLSELVEQFKLSVQDLKDVDELKKQTGEEDRGGKTNNRTHMQNKKQNRSDKGEQEIEIDEDDFEKF